MKCKIDNTVKLYDLVKMDDTLEVFNETKKIISMIYENFEYALFEKVYNDVIRLFRGEYPGYRGCNTDYHDLNHTLNTLLATIRLIHGYSIKKERFHEHIVLIGLFAALFHDTGYIQKTGDKKGTGARYTLKHVDRSIKFAKNYLYQNKATIDDIYACACMIKCTELTKNIDKIKFNSHDAMVIGKILGTADSIGQMADRLYLEKLLFLFKEFNEGNIYKFINEFDLIKKTVSFYNFILDRWKKQLGGMNRFMVYHFKVRWGINEDLYQKAIDNNINYLKKIVNDVSENYLSYLKRGNISKKSIQI
ncbi:MAG TPA: hypothetical protein PKZ54_10105 [Syntrophorhabdaceae bacterium]|nr:hypothetical protein [Syntrophorhabdaceae bacterium]